LKHFKKQPKWNDFKGAWKNRLEDNATISEKFGFSKIDLSKVDTVSGLDFKQLAII